MQNYILWKEAQYRNLTTLCNGLLTLQSMPVGVIICQGERQSPFSLHQLNITHMIPNLHLKLPPNPHQKIEGAFRNNTNKILYKGNQFHWTSPDGGWKTYNYDGYLLQYGTEEGTIANLKYVDNKLTTIEDRYEQTIYTYEYEDNKITITDYSGRKVIYHRLVSKTLPGDRTYM